MHDSAWNDDDPEAPETPWGPAQVSYDLAPGVRWYGTAGHGGLEVESRAARELSPAARELGDYELGSYWYEEDSQWAIPMYEKPEWNRVLARKAGGKLWSQEALAEQIRDYFPRYFRMSGQEKVAMSPMLRRIAKVFVDQKALDRYLKQHPEADPSKHRVRTLPSERGKKKKDDGKAAPFGKDIPGKMRNRAVEPFSWGDETHPFRSA